MPATFQTAGSGEAVVAGDGRCALVSFITAPLAASRDNVYVVFVTDTTLAALLNNPPGDFETLAAKGGCGVPLPLLGLLAFTKLPEPFNRRAAALPHWL